MDRVHCFPLYTVGPGWTRWAHILLWVGSNPTYGTVYVAQLVRVLDCESRGRGFKSHHTPNKCLGGGIGSHAGLKILCSYGRAGSIPARGTTAHIVQWIERSATNREIGVRVTLRVQMPL